MRTVGSDVDRYRHVTSSRQSWAGAVGAVLVAAVVLSLGGCSLLGWRVGASADAKKPDSTAVQSWQLETLPVGRKLVVYLVDGTVVRGTFQGVALDTLAAYADRYATFAAAQPMPTGFPAPGDRVTLRRTRGSTVDAVLVAYDFNRVVVRPESGDVLSVELQDLSVIEWQDRSIPRFPLRSWLQFSRVPLLSSLLIDERGPTASGSGSTARGKSPGGTAPSLRRRVPISEVVQVQYATIKHGARNGFIAGLLVDAVIVAVAISTSGGDDPPPQPAPPPTGGEGSCPLIYSYDGRSHVLDAEAFSGAILKQLQQADYALLEHLEPVDGVCRIRVANHLPETHYVDQLELIAVDHPRDVEVLPEGPGRWRTISDPQPPFEATDDAGGIVTPLVAGHDSSYWISSPLGRDPAQQRSLRDGLVLRFARPADARQAKLVLTLLNTPWLTELEHRLLELPGAMLGLWSAQMNASATDRRVFTDALHRELGLRAELWNGTTWTPVTSLPFVGPFVPRSVVLPVDLSDVRSDELRIRIESAPGMWMVDCVGADFGPDLPVRATSVAAGAAVDATGRDVRGRIAGVDGNYLRLEAGDRTDVSFPVTPPPPGLERSYVVVCDGYYTIHVDARGLPQLALMRKLAREPGAGSAYATGVMNRWVARELPASVGAVPIARN